MPFGYSLPNMPRPSSWKNWYPINWKLTTSRQPKGDENIESSTDPAYHQDEARDISSSALLPPPSKEKHPIPNKNDLSNGHRQSSKPSPGRHDNLTPIGPSSVGPPPPALTIPKQRTKKRKGRATVPNDQLSEGGVSLREDKATFAQELEESHSLVQEIEKLRTEVKAWQEKLFESQKANSDIISYNEELIARVKLEISLVADLKFQLDAERVHANGVYQRLKANVAAKQAEIDEIQRIHINAINNIGTGIEPISEDQLIKSFRDIRSQIGSFCRGAFKRRRFRTDVTQLQCFGGLFEDLFEASELSTSQKAETMFWRMIETEIATQMLPGLSPNGDKLFQRFQQGITKADELPYDRAEFWRAYTCQMLVQNPDLKQCLTKMADALLNDLIFIFSEAIDGCSSDSMRGLGLHTIIEIVIHLFSSLRCQRASYSLHHEVQVGVPYDPEYMESLGPNEDVDSSSVVAGIIARGIVRRPHEGSPKILGVVSRSKVLLGNAEVMPMH